MDYSGKIINKNEVVPTQTSASGVWSLQEAAAAVRGNNWPVAGVPNPISKSLRFNSADSAYLNRTPGVAGNRRTFTMNYWLKRAELGTRQVLASAGTGANAGHAIELQADNTLTIYANNTGAAITVTTTQVFRDPSAWGMLTIAFDTTQSTASNRVKVYWNGTQITAFSTATYPSQNADLEFNNNVPQNIGRREISTTFYCGLYLTETIWIDGQQLTPSSFGMTDPQTGAWEPIKYTGTYGTNGFYLNFKDATSTTTLGYDYSGNNNNWTTNNFSVTAGAGNDSLTDVPTPWIAYNTTGDVGGVVRGNYATWNPLTLTYGTLSNGNLNYVGNSTNHDMIVATSGQTTGKWYCEVTLTNATAADQYSMGGVVNLNSYTPRYSPTYPGGNAASWGYYPDDGGNPGIYNNNARTDTLAAGSTNDVIGMALDCDAGTLAWYKNNSLLITKTIGSGNWAFVVGHQGANCNINFGQRPFAYTPPAGFLSLCSTNLPTPTIGFGLTNQSDDYFDIQLWAGNNTNEWKSSNVSKFNVDFGWIKNRTAAYDNTLVDIVRGDNNGLVSNSTAAENSAVGVLIGGYGSYTANAGQVYTNGIGYPALNVTGNNYVNWRWRANGAGSSNTAGTITSTVSANTTAGFSIVTYTTPASGNYTVGHGLGVAPSMIINKTRGTTSGWITWHIGLTGGASNSSYYLELNTTGAQVSGSGVWGAAAPTSTVFGMNAGFSVAASQTQVAYCFAAVAGYSAFGSYTGNGSTDGPFVYTGFRPRWIMYKDSSTTNPWVIIDTVRQTYNVLGPYLLPNASDAEGTATVLDSLSNGFKIRVGTGSSANTTNNVIIYAAFAESPFKFANAR